MGPELGGKGFGVASGPVVARVFHRWVALVFLIAFVSLGAQVDLLFGAEGLSPIAPRAAAVADTSWLHSPSWLRLATSDMGIRAGVVVGVVCAGLALFGVFPRLCLVIATIDYLGYVILGEPFSSFQWDNMLIETGFLLAFLPRRHRSRLVHALFLLLFVKVYFESGIAKWQSHQGDWTDGSAMTYYYETAPIPGWLAWEFHNLPARWHVFESRAVLVIELLVPWLAFGPRGAKRLCLAIVTTFQLLNLLTANYGFFVYLTLGLHLFLLEDADLERAWAWLRGHMRPLVPAVPAPVMGAHPRWRRVAGTTIAGAVAAYWIGFSLLSGVGTFGNSDWWRTRARQSMYLYARPRLVNDYHLFGHITRERIEPRLEVLEGETWRELSLHHEPGPLDRAPATVAPHQPRVDFQLWFYGLSYRSGLPRYVWRLMEGVCRDGSPTHGLFVDPPAPAPRAIRLVYWRYWMTTRPQRAATGDLWLRRRLSTGRPIACPTA